MTARPLREALIVFALAATASVACFQIARFVPFVADNLQAFIAAIFLYLPVAVSWRRHEDLREYGVTLRPFGRTAAFALLVPLVVFPLFVVAFGGFYQMVCAPAAPAWLTALAPQRWCARFAGWGGLAHPHAPEDFWTAALTQLVVVALPEELFFRGYLLKRLEERWPPTRRWLGGGIGLALVVSSALFALGHVIVGASPGRFAVFFPGLLFGWMRSATRSIAPGALVHAGSNLFIDALQRTFFV